jgi:hypothetical protein
MTSPPSTSIQHKRVITHSVQHEVRWDYLVIAVVVGYIAVKLLGGIGAGSSDDVSVDVEPTRGDTTKALSGAWSGN